MHCIGTIAFAPVFACADEDANKSITPVPVDNFQVGAAHQFITSQRANTKDMKASRWILQIFFQPTLNRITGLQTRGVCLKQAVKFPITTPSSKCFSKLIRIYSR